VVQELLTLPEHLNSIPVFCFICIVLIVIFLSCLAIVMSTFPFTFCSPLVSSNLSTLTMEAPEVADICPSFSAAENNPCEYCRTN
jgi:hypothetical protein